MAEIVFSQHEVTDTKKAHLLGSAVKRKKDTVVDLPNFQTFNPRLPNEAALFDYWAFIDLINFKGGRESFADFHFEMMEFVAAPQLKDTTKRRRLNLVPRGHLKSTTGTVAYVLWRIYRNPDIRIGVGTATKDLAHQFIREIKQYLEDEHLQTTVWNNRPHYPRQRLIPILDKAGLTRRHQIWQEDTESLDKKIVWRSDCIQVIRPGVFKEPTVIAMSPGSNATGMHFDLLILDDIINDDSCATPAKMQKTLEWTRDLEAILDPQRTVQFGQRKQYFEQVGDEVVIHGTRYAKGDYYEYLIDNLSLFEYHLYFKNVYKNGRDESDGYLWGEKFNASVVEKIRKRIGVIRFASQYLNKVVVSEDVILDTEQIKFYGSNQEVDYRPNGIVRIRLPIENKEYKHYDIHPVIVIDPAISQKKTADDSVIMVGGFTEDKDLVILDFKHGKILPDEIINQTYMLADKWQTNDVWVEVVSFQQALVYMFRSRFNNQRPLCVREYKPKGEKKARIQTALQPLFFNRKIFAPDWTRTVPDFREEIQYFPSPTAKDDIIDAMAMLVEIATPTPFRGKKQRNTYNDFAIDSKYGGRLRW